MSNTNSRAHSRKISTKARAVLAGGLVLGLGAAFTLAAWTDNEWVFGQSGGADGPGGPGTGTYQMQQNTFSGAGGIAAWSDQPDQNGGGLTFSVGAANLVPGTTVYAPMQLRAVADSNALTVTLAEGVQAGTPVDATTNSPALYAALTYEAVANVPATECTATGSRTGALPLVAAGSPLSANGAAAPFALPAGAPGVEGAAVDICFAITLPASVTDSTLQGKNTVPLWRFTSTTGS